MTTDSETQLRAELAAAAPPESAQPALATVLADGRAALRRRSALRSLATLAGVVILAAGGVYGWSHAVPSSARLPAASPRITATPTSAEWTVRYSTANASGSPAISVVTYRYQAADQTIRVYHAPAGSQAMPGTLVASIPVHAISTPQLHRTSLPELSVVVAPVDTQWVSVVGTKAGGLPTETGPGAPVAVGTELTGAPVPNDPAIIWRDGAGVIHSSTGDPAVVVTVPGTDPGSVLFVFRTLGVLGVSDGRGAITTSLAGPSGAIHPLAHGQNVASGSPARWYSTFLLPSGAHNVTVVPAGGATPVGAVATTDVPGGGVAATLTYTTTSAPGTPTPITTITWVDSSGRTHTTTPSR